MKEKFFKLALKKSATLFFVAVFIVSTGFNLTMPFSLLRPFTAVAQESNETQVESVTEVKSETTEEAVVDEPTEAVEETLVEETPADFSVSEALETTLDTVKAAVLGDTAEGNENANSGAIWTTTGSCGTPQNINHYNVGDVVYINYDGFGAGTYPWDITGKPGGASSDPDIAVAEGDEIVDATGAGCFDAYIVLAGDDGEYGVSMGNKKDNYNVEGEEEEEDECKKDPTKCEPEDEDTATISAVKIVCDNESDLPNWGDNEPNINITNTTATEFLDTHPNCHQESWTFEWAPSVATNPGDNTIGATGGIWTPFNTTTIVPSGSLIWVREQVEVGYIDFSGDISEPLDDNISAELYCSSDVLNYDNYDFIDPVLEDTTYHCIGFNVLEEDEGDACEVTGPNLVQNGSFELPVVVDVEKWDLYNAIQDWVVNNEVELIRGYDGWLASDLLQFATLDTCDCGNSISQTIPTTATKTYKVSFDYAAQPGSDTASNNINFSLDGGAPQLFTDSNNDVNSAVEWNTHEETFVADSSTDITFTRSGAKDGMGNFLDNVVVAECNPEDLCVEGPTWADEVITSSQGTRKDGSAVLANRTNPDNTLGTPDGNGNTGTGFFSLGKEGTITVKFDKYVENMDGVDLSFHEITNGRNSYPEEKASVEVSQNGTDWETIGTVSSTAVNGVAYLDFDSTGWSWIQYVKITDTTNFALHSNDADGYDVDAIDATNGLCSEPDDRTTTLTVIKNVVGGDADADDFSLIVNSTGANPAGQFPGSAIGTVVTLVPGQVYGVAESLSPGYTPSFSEDCSGTIEEGENLTCTVTNTFNDEPQVCEETPKTYYSDSSVQVDGHDSVNVNPIHDAWDATIAGATWIWSENPIADAVAETTKTFTKTFTIVGTPEGATLDIASDNSYVVTVNGNPVGADATENNHATADQYIISADDLVTGENTLTITVKNFAQGGGTMATNPAGLLFKLVVNEECEVNVCVVGEELIKNGGFELPEMTNANGWDIYASGTATLEWLATWLTPDFDAPATANIEIQEDGLLGWTTPYGDQWAELDADYGFNANESSATRISQDLTTEIGAIYEVKYSFGARPGVLANAIDVKVDGVSKDTQTDDGTGDINIAWIDDSFSFTATDTTTTISFENTDTSDSLGSFLDEVSVKCTEDDGGGDNDPEPECGDGITNGDEECDDGNEIDNDDCSNTCTEDGSGGSEDPDCGNGVVESGEACDDGNDDDSDDCSNSCVDNSDGGGSSGGGGGGGSSSRSGSPANTSTTDDGTGNGGEVLGESLAATGTENISYLALAGLILAFLVATKRRKAII